MWKVPPLSFRDSGYHLSLWAFRGQSEGGSCVPCLCPVLEGLPLSQLFSHNRPEAAVAFSLSGVVFGPPLLGLGSPLVCSPPSIPSPVD